MFQTGLLILTSPSRALVPHVGAYLRAAKNLVNKTLYIKLELGKQQLWPLQQTAFSPSEMVHLYKLIPGIYFEAAAMCSNLDVRVLQSFIKDTALKDLNLKPSFDIVLTDSHQTNSEIEQYVYYQFSKECKNVQKLTDVIPSDSAMNNNNDVNINDVMPDKLYSSVCLGGTFDRLHTGHKAFLSKAMLLCSNRLVIGVTDGDLIKGKLLWELIEPVELRKEKLLDFLTEVDSTIKYDIIPIYDPYGPTIKESDLKCLVVSEETLKGGNRVNEERNKRGMPPMDLFVSSLVEDSCRNSYEESKISSSSMRMRLLGTTIRPPIPKPHLPKLPYLIGLTGGICSGKSNITKAVESFGGAVLNCDKLAHESYLPGTEAHAKLIETFGKDILNEDNTINRKKLGAIVFGNEEARQTLNRIVWPETSKLIQGRVKEFAQKGVGCVVLEVALLFEAGWDDMVHQVWVTIINEKEAIKRLKNRDGLNEEQSAQRIKAQMTNMERMQKANVVFCSLWEYSYTKQQVQRAWNELQQYLEKEINSSL